MIRTDGPWRRVTIIATAVFLLGFLVASADSPASRNRLKAHDRETHPLLIKHGWDAPSAQFVADHAPEMDLLGYDGVMIRLGDYWDRIPSSTPVTEEELRTELEPLTSATLSTLVHNFVIIYTTAGARYFEDYDTPLRNYRALARVARDLGIEGVVIDTEDYYPGRLVQDWPGGAPNHGLPESRGQAMLRGEQVMAAMAAEWPDITVIVLGGPWLAEPKTAAEFGSTFPYQDAASTTELRGAFFLGLANSAVGTAATLVDGGALYTPRTPEQFQLAYDWLKFGMAQRGEFVPEPLRKVYPEVVSVGFGVFDRPYLGAPMDSSIWEATLVNALGRTDRYVWAYTEAFDWWGTGQLEGRVPESWVAATQAAVLHARSRVIG